MDRRRILQGAAATAAAALLPASARAVAASTGETDYPQAAWAPASPSNYTAANRPSSHPVDFVVLHVTQATFSNTVGIFANPAKQVSAHYVVRSADGYIV